MPTYDYECKSCGSTFEYFQSMNEEPLSECCECRGSLKRLIGGGLGVIFKGSGFYITDNKGKSSTNTTAKTESSENFGKTESVAAKKTEPKKETVKTSS